MSRVKHAENNSPKCVEFRTDVIDQLYEISINLASIADTLEMIDTHLKIISKNMKKGEK